MRDLTWYDIKGAVDTIYSVATEAGPVPLRLAAAGSLADSGRVGGAFRLIFLGPLDPVLPQAIYLFSGDGVDPFEIFIVPVGSDENGTLYEAIFY